MAPLHAAAATSSPKCLHPIGTVTPSIATSLPGLPLRKPGPCRNERVSGTAAPGAKRGSPAPRLTGGLIQVFLQFPESSGDLPSALRPSLAGRGPGRGGSPSSSQPLPWALPLGSSGYGHRQRVPAVELLLLSAGLLTSPPKKPPAGFFLPALLQQACATHCGQTPLVA